MRQTRRLLYLFALAQGAPPLPPILGAGVPESFRHLQRPESAGDTAGPAKTGQTEPRTSSRNLTAQDSLPDTRNKTQTAPGPQPLRPSRGVQHPEVPPHWHRKKRQKEWTKDLGEVSNAFENRAKLRAEKRWLLKRATIVICHGGPLSASIPSMRVIGRWVPSQGNRCCILGITEVYLVRNHTSARVPLIPKATIRAEPQIAPCRRHRGHLDRPYCDELYQREPIRFDIWQKVNSMNLAFHQMLHNVTCHYWGWETK